MRRQRLVDGGGTQQTAQLLTAHHLEVESEGPSQQTRRLPHLSGFHETADTAGADRLPVHQNRRDDHRFKAVLLSQGRQGRGVPGPVPAKPEIEAAADPPGPEDVPQYPPHEFLRRKKADGLEIRLEHLLHPQGFHGGYLAVGGKQLPGAVLGQPPGGLGKGEDRRDAALQAHRPGYHRPMAQMDTVENPQGHGPGGIGNGGGLRRQGIDAHG